MWGFAPVLRRVGQQVGFIEIVIGGCAGLYLLMLVSDLGGIRSGGMMTFLSPSTRSMLRFGASGALPVFELGRWWTPLSAGWLHGGLLHILFNMLWVRQLAPAVAAQYGSSRLILLYVGSSVVGFVLSTASFLLPGFLGAIMGRGALTLGASAAVFGLLGAMVYAGRRGVGSSLGRQAWTYALVLGVFGLLFPGVDNWAHLGGFLGGYGLGRWLDPLRPERADHATAALLCLVASAAAVAASLLVD